MSNAKQIRQMFYKLVKPIKRKESITQGALDLLLANEPFTKDGPGRIAMTVSCHDADYIPKVKNAGKVETKNGQSVQVMHNGVIVRAGGYHGDWMSKVISELRGHHEPQEEKVFYEILQKIKGPATMIELGSFWSYYSLWFHHDVNRARNICCEPDEDNLRIGKANAELNEADITFILAAAGSKDGRKLRLAMDSNPRVTRSIPIRSVDGLVRDYGIKHLDLLHVDIQGYELDALHGAIQAIKQKKLRFLIISTHHYFFSKDPLTHQKCIDYIKTNGGHIIASHTVLESFSGDGLIAASFDRRDRNMRVEVSINHSDNSFFRPYEEDLAFLIRSYDRLARLK